MGPYGPNIFGTLDTIYIHIHIVRNSILLVEIIIT